MDKIKLVVLNEHTLGYMSPTCNYVVHVFAHSVLRGAGCFLGWTEKCIGQHDVVRLATEQDFDDFRVSFVGFKTDNNYLYSRPDQAL
jgi:hypothetical protein